MAIATEGVHPQYGGFVSCWRTCSYFILVPWHLLRRSKILELGILQPQFSLITMQWRLYQVNLLGLWYGLGRLLISGDPQTTVHAIYISLMQSLVLYGSETCTLRKVDNERIQSFHMRAVQERTELPDLPSLIADRRHSLFGHVCHLPIRTHLPRKLSVDAHTGIPPAADWKRPPGRPRKTWLQQVEEDCGISVGLAQITSQDRSLWRSLRPSAGQWSLVKRSSEWVSEWVSESSPTDDFSAQCVRQCPSKDLVCI